MKNLLATLAIIFFSLIALPEKAEAGHGHHGSSYTYRSSYSTCGCPIYKRRVIASYDCYHRPVYRYYSVPIVHRCRSHYRPHYRSHYRSHYNRGYHSSYSSRYRYPSYSSGYRGHGVRLSYSGRHGSINVCR